MFSQNHQQGGPPNPRLNGASSQRLPLLYNYPQQSQGPPQPHQAHAQHHQSMQPDHGSHAGNNNGPMLSHHASFAAGVLSTPSPYNNAIQNGHSAVSRNNQAYPEHWQKQLKKREECANANLAMKEGIPHYWARLKASENKGIGAPPSSEKAAVAAAAAAAAAGGKQDGRSIPWSLDAPNNRQDWHNMDLSGQGFRNIALQLSDYDFLHELYIATNKLTHLPASIGQLRHLRHLDASFNMIQELPPEIGMCTYLQSLLLFDNRIQELPFEMGSLHMLDMLGIEGNPLESFFKQEVMEKGTMSLISKLRESGRVPAPPPPRQPVTVQEDVSPSLERLKVFTWNVLCDKYSDSKRYGYTPSEALSWDYRKNYILEELRERDADILCLQEVSRDAFEVFFKPELGRLGYRGFQHSKPRAHLMKDGDLVDGCAIFYKENKYACVEEQIIDITMLAINRDDMKKCDDVFNRVMPQGNIATVCLLESHRTGARFIVVSAHLTWHPSMADVKVVQAGVLMEYVTKLANQYARRPPPKDKSSHKDKQPATLPSHAAGGDEGQDGAAPPTEKIEPVRSQEYRNSTDIPMLVCGDFNSMANSSVYELMSTGHLSPEHPDVANFQYGDFTSDGIKHPFNLRDSYVHVNGTADDLPFTNYTPAFVGVIDYIWYSANTLEVVALLGPPDAEYLKRVPAFPFYHFPSDHIQIMAEFVVKARKDRKLPESEGSSSDRRV